VFRENPIHTGAVNTLVRRCHDRITYSLFKELNMKKRFVLMGLVSVLLMAVLLFAACPLMGGGGDGNGDVTTPADDDAIPAVPDADDVSVTVPTADKLPDLPSGSTPVSNATEAKALLNAFGASGAGWRLEEDIQSVIGEHTLLSVTNTSWKLEWDFKDDDETESGLKVTSAGNESISWKISEYEEGKTPSMKGEYMSASASKKVTAEVTEDRPYGSVTLVAGSTIAHALSSDTLISCTAVSGNSITVKNEGSMQDAYGVGMTVIQGNKAGKIIIDLYGKISGSVTTTMQIGDDGYDGEGPDMPAPTVSGSIKVYGASNTNPLYTLPITKDNIEVLGDLGIYFLNNTIEHPADDEEQYGGSFWD
jgi:hypothetical protein